MNGRKLLLALIAAVVLSAPVQAQTPSPADTRASELPADAPLNPRSTTSLFAPEKSASGGSNQLIVYFVVLVALAGGGLYFLKRGLPLRGMRLGENHLHLLETKMLGNRQFLVVVKYGDNKMLVGVGPGQIQYLCPLDSADEDMESLIRKGGADPGPGMA